MHHIHAPHPWPSERYTVFLSGSIAMGQAAFWQDEVVTALADYGGVLLNPRRDDWDNTWHQSLTDARFVEQVQWELRGLAAANAVLMHFDPATQSSITLLELGLLLPRVHSRASVWLYVSCPEGFWRRGNVAITCQEYDVPLYGSLEESLRMFQDHHAFLLSGHH